MWDFLAPLSLRGYKERAAINKKTVRVAVLWVENTTSKDGKIRQRREGHLTEFIRGWETTSDKTFTEIFDQ